MASPTSVRSQVGGGVCVTIIHDASGLNVRSPEISHHQTRDPLASPPTGDIQTCSFEEHPNPPVLTSDDLVSLYGWQAGGTHPIVMLSDLKIKLSHNIKSLRLGVAFLP